MEAEDDNPVQAGKDASPDLEDATGVDTAASAEKTAVADANGDVAGHEAEGAKEDRMDEVDEGGEVEANGIDKPPVQATELKADLNEPAEGGGLDEGEIAGEAGVDAEVVIQADENAKESVKDEAEKGEDQKVDEEGKAPEKGEGAGGGSPVSVDLATPERKKEGSPSEDEVKELRKSRDRKRSRSPHSRKRSRSPKSRSRSRKNRSRSAGRRGRSSSLESGERRRSRKRSPSRGRRHSRRSPTLEKRRRGRSRSPSLSPKRRRRSTSSSPRRRLRSNSPGKSRSRTRSHSRGRDRSRRRSRSRSSSRRRSGSPYRRRSPSPSRRRYRSPPWRSRHADTEVCRDFLAGRCNRGHHCRFSHGSGGAASDPYTEVCRDYLTGRCTRPRCRFLHSGAPPCRDFAMGRCTRSESCRCAAQATLAMYLLKGNERCLSWRYLQPWKRGAVTEIFGEVMALFGKIVFQLQRGCVGLSVIWLRTWLQVLTF